MLCAQQSRKNLKLSEEQGMQLYGLRHLHVLRDATSATKALVAWGPTDLLIAFRGTANIQNAFHDAKVNAAQAQLCLQQ